MKDQPRTLAYSLAKEITYHELEQVAGGSGGSICQRPTFKVSGTNGSWDAAVDVTIDW